MLKQNSLFQINLLRSTYSYLILFTLVSYFSATNSKTLAIQKPELHPDKSEIEAIKKTTQLQAQVIQKSERHPSKTEIEAIKMETQSHIQNMRGGSSSDYIDDNRSPLLKKKVLDFQNSWQKVNPSVAQFLGVWPGYEHSVEIYPSTINNQVCLSFESSETEEDDDEWDIGIVEDKYIITKDKRVFFKVGEYLGIALIANNKVQQGHETPLRPPYPLENNVSSKVASGLCTTKLPNQVFKEQGDEYYDSKSWSEAINKYTMAIQLSPRYTATIYNRGLAYYYNGQNELALSDLTKAAQLYQEQDKEKDGSIPLWRCV
jgi:TPR repeat